MEPLYGQKDLAEFCEFVIASLFEVAPASPQHKQQVHDGRRQGIDTPPYTPPPEATPSPSSAASTSQQRKEPPALVDFIAYALYRTRLPISIVNQSLLLLSRLKQRYPSARGTSSSPHRLFLSSLMLSAKISMDDTYSNKSWAIVGSSYFPLREVNQMERELFAFLGWNVVVQKDELDSFVASAEASYAAAKAFKKAERAKRRRLEEDEARDSRHRQATNAARALLRPHTYRHPTSPTTASASCSFASSSGAYTPASLASSPTMHDSPVASTSSQATSPSCSSASQHPYDFAASSSSASAMQARTPYTPSSSSSISSSAVSSAFPSATHSPTSPASEPFSAGPQTPDSDFNHLHHHHQQQQPYHPTSAAAQYHYNQHHQQHYSQHEISADFPEADSYMKSKARSISPPNRKSFRPHASSPSFMHALSSQQVHA